MVEDRPEPGNPNGFEAIDKTKCDEPHGSGYIEHAGGIGKAEHIPGQVAASEVIVINVLCGLFANVESDENSSEQIDKNNGEIKCTDHGHPPRKVGS